MAHLLAPHVSIYIRVLAYSLTSTCLQGTHTFTFSSIGHYIFLHRNLSGRQIAGAQIPQGTGGDIWASLPSLMTLDLSNTGLAGTVPEAVGEAAALTDV